MSSNSSLLPLVESSFHVVDYVVFAAFLCISGAVGVFFSMRGQKNTQDYFLGGRNMRPVPVGISAGVSFMSAASLVGLPAETYINGYSYMLSLPAASLGFFLGCVLITSILQPLSITRIGEYLQQRYQSRVITYSTNVMVLLCILEYMGVCMLGSVIAFSSFTGGQVSVVVALVIGCVVGIFYTSIGGMKAVVWSDVIQFVFMLVAIVTVIICSIVDTPGGMSEVIRLGVKHQRIHVPQWTFDLTVRHTVWGLSIGMVVTWMAWCVQPACVQRLCCLNSKKDGYIVAAIASSIFFILAMLPSWAGLNLFGYYTSRGCDVYAAGWIKNNEIILYYVRERINFPGFQGLFVAALYAGSLSSLSSGLNAASSILWKDFISHLLKSEISETRAILISKGIVVVFGVLSMLWCYTLHELGGLIIQMSYTVDASMYGAYFGVFILSVSCIYATWKGALAGMVVSFIFTASLGIQSLLSGRAAGQKLSTTIDNCALNSTAPSWNMTSPATHVTESTTPDNSFLGTLCSISYEWMTPTCLFVFLSVSLAVMGWTGPRQASEVDSNFVAAVCLPGFCRRRCAADEADEENEESSTSEEDMKKAHQEELNGEADRRLLQNCEEHPHGEVSV